MPMRPSPHAAGRPSPLMNALAAWALTLLAGCAVLPEPTGDEVREQALGHVAIPPNWSAQASAAQVEDGWLSTFHDPVLSQLVFEALANNPDLTMAAARV